tara:strand:+ start:2393 stop:2617 length:225 start_codon:yes stop_codon:yes gene_type:complete
MNDVVLDMLQFSRNEKALDFENTFKDIMNDRITNAINNKKLEVAQNIFKNPVEDTEEDEVVAAEENTEEEESNG